jgi:hypothetical protein
MKSTHPTETGPKAIPILLAGLLFMLWLGLLLVQTGAVSAAAENGYELQWWSQDGGGAIQVTESGYGLSGTIGQPDAHTWSGLAYQLDGGFWPQIWRTVWHQLFLPAIRH